MCILQGEVGNEWDWNHQNLAGRERAAVLFEAATCCYLIHKLFFPTLVAQAQRKAVINDIQIYSFFKKDSRSQGSFKRHCKAFKLKEASQQSCDLALLRYQQSFLNKGWKAAKEVFIHTSTSAYISEVTRSSWEHPLRLSGRQWVGIITNPNRKILSSQKKPQPPQSAKPSCLPIHGY